MKRPVHSSVVASSFLCCCQCYTLVVVVVVVVIAVVVVVVVVIVIIIVVVVVVIIVVVEGDPVYQGGEREGPRTGYQAGHQPGIHCSELLRRKYPGRYFTSSSSNSVCSSLWLLMIIRVCAEVFHAGVGWACWLSTHGLLLSPRPFHARLRISWSVINLNTLY